MILVKNCKIRKDCHIIVFTIKKRKRMVYAFSKTKRMFNSYTTSTESYLLNYRIEKTTYKNPHPG